MKSTILLTILLSTLLFSCKKEQDENVIVDNSSFIYSVKYACGPSCDGLAWVLKTPEGFFETTNLPDSFRKDALQVKVSFTKTGRTAPQWQGTGVELVNIVQITER